MKIPLLLLFAVFLTNAIATEVPSGQDYCTSSSDCRGNKTCKDRGDKVRVCMGDGLHGYFCNSSTDCKGGGFCKDPGDGLKRCMSKGAANQPCSSSLHCASGLTCKDRGDGLKLCL